MKIASDIRKRVVILLWCVAVSLFLWYFTLGASREGYFLQFVNFCIVLFGGGFAYHIVSLLVVRPYNEANSNYWKQIMWGLVRVYIGYVIAGVTLVVGRKLEHGFGWLVAFPGLIAGMFVSQYFLMKLNLPLRQLLSSGETANMDPVDVTEAQRGRSHDERDFKGFEDQKKKDRWDKFAVVTSAMVPLSIALVGGVYSCTSKNAETEVARLRANADNKIKQAELVSRFWDSLTSPDDQKRRLAVDSLLVAAPDYGSIVVRALQKSTKDAQTAAYASSALDARSDILVRQLFDHDADVRQEAYNQLISSWGSDENLVEKLLSYARSNKSNLNGIYNSLVLLNNMQLDSVRTKARDVIAFAKAVEDNGSKTKTLAESLIARLK